MKNVCTPGAWLLTLALLFCTGLTSTLSAEKVAIVDAGSSGSRLYVYEIDATCAQPVRLVYPMTKEQKKKSKGRALSSVANHSDSVYVFLQSLTANYVADSVDLYVMATAGMRLKPKAQADAIYEKLEALPLVNGYSVKGAMTITGQYEGLYGWLAANYQNGTIGFNTAATPQTLTYTGTPCGILEIGGASMQLAFTTTSTHEDGLTRPGLGQIYCKSYLGAGADQMYRKSPRKGNTYEMVLDFEDVSDLYGKDMLFWGLSHPLNNVLNGMKEHPNKRSNKAKIKAYVKSLKHFEDSEKNYHPRFNSHYIQKLLREMGLRDRLIQSDKDDSWTLGAALDIAVYGEEPAAFDHDHIR